MFQSTVQSDRPESQVKETGAVMKEEFEKIMKNDVRMVGGESENNCKSNKNNEENENKNYFSNQFQRKSQEYERLKREHIDKGKIFITFMKMIKVCKIL